MIALTSAQLAAAEPAPRERAAIVAIDLGPGVPAYLAATARARIESGLAAAGYDVAAGAPPLAAELAACREGACVRAIGKALAVPVVVYAAIELQDGNTVVAMRLFDGGTGERDAEVREVCDLCGEAELSERIGVAASALGARAIEPRERRAKAIAKPIEVPRPPPPPPPPPPSRSVIPGLAIGAVGVGLLGAGIYLIVLDGKGTCSPGDKPEFPDRGAVIRYPDPSNRDVYFCREVYTTRTMGIAGAGAGALALVVGAVLVVRARDRSRAVEVSPLPGGAAVKVSLPW